MHALGETGVYEGAGRGAGSASRRPAARASPPAASAATRARASCSPTRRCRSTPGRAASRAACRSPRTAAAPGARRTARCSRPCARRAGATSGARRRARGRRSGRSRSPRASRSWPTWACAASCCPAAARRRSTGSRRRRTADRRGASCTRSRTSRRPNLAGSWIEPRARGGRPLGLVRLALRPRGGAERPRRRVRDRPLPHLPDDRRRQDLGAGQLRAPRRGPLDDAAAST